MVKDAQRKSGHTKGHCLSWLESWSLQPRSYGDMFNDTCRPKHVRATSLLAMCLGIGACPQCLREQRLQSKVCYRVRDACMPSSLLRICADLLPL